MLSVLREPHQGRYSVSRLSSGGNISSTTLDRGSLRVVLGGDSSDWVLSYSSSTVFTSFLLIDHKLRASFHTLLGFLCVHPTGANSDTNLGDVTIAGRSNSFIRYSCLADLGKMMAIEFVWSFSSSEVVIRDSVSDSQSQLSFPSDNFGVPGFVKLLAEDFTCISALGRSLAVSNSRATSCQGRNRLFPSCYQYQLTSLSFSFQIK